MKFEQIKELGEQGTDIAISHGLVITEADYYIDYNRGERGLNENGLKKLAILLDIAKGAKQ